MLFLAQLPSPASPNFSQNLRHLTQETLSSIQHLMEEVQKERAHMQLGMQAQQLTAAGTACLTITNKHKHDTPGSAARITGQPGFTAPPEVV